MGCGAPSKPARDDGGVESRKATNRSAAQTGNDADTEPRRQSYRRSNSGGSMASGKKKGKKGNNKNGTKSPDNSRHNRNNGTATTSSMSSMHHDVNGTSNGSANGTTDIMSKDNPHWKLLWESFSASLVDPADVHCMLEDLMAQIINKLSPTEVVFLQRKVRKVVRTLPKSTKTTKRMNRILNSSNGSSKDDGNGDGTYQFANASELEARTIADRHHLLTAAVMKKVLPTIASSDAVCNPMENAYILMLFLNDALWDTVAKIAKDDATEAGLEMDVNKLPESQSRPRPSIPLNEPFEFPQGISFSSYAFMVALALRGSRTQRLQLLFYLLLPPKALLAFLQAHPAGGVPTWLLEVGSSNVISVSSLSHYHLYGDVFLPGRNRTPNVHNSNSSAPPLLSVDASHANTILQGLMKPKSRRKATTDPGKSLSPSSASISGFNGKDGPQSPVRKSASLGLMRRGSNHKDSEGDSSAGGNSSFPQSEVMERLYNTGPSAPTSTKNSHNSGDSVASGASDFGESSSSGKDAKAPIDLEGYWKRLIAEQGVSNDIDATSIGIMRFCQLAESTLDDAALDVIMERIFVDGTLPDRQLELDLVKSRWLKWQKAEGSLWFTLQSKGTVEGMKQSIQSFIRSQNSDSTITDSNPSKQRKAPPFGGIGGFDGLGAMGQGIMFVIDKPWWDSWIAYAGWQWGDASQNGTAPERARERPGALSTEGLLDRDCEDHVPGTLGSYEQIKDGLKKDVDYVLVPPVVWEVLYEMYGGGPPLPRIVSPPQSTSTGSFAHDIDIPNEEVEVNLTAVVEEDDTLTSMNLTSTDNAYRLPKNLDVKIHPWVLQVHLCDPQQPYRRGDAGPMSVRVMVLPDQPLWRLYAELVSRLPFHLYKSYDTTTGRGRARLWKRTDPATAKDAMARYGPWALLCKNRFAVVPVQNTQKELKDKYGELKANWLEYSDSASIESADLLDGDHLMVECAVLNRSNEFMWPREAAAKAGRERRLAEGELKFRRLLRGQDKSGKRLPNPPELVGMSIDAMDASGRWYQVDIARVQVAAEDTDEEDEDDDSLAMDPVTPPTVPQESSERKQVLVDFTEHGGHEEWIDTDSDRLATAGRFTLGKQDDVPEPPNKNANGNSNDNKSKSVSVVKKVVADPNEGNGKMCTLPGYGACGLSNLGNTCYINSAIQCMSYLPLLRSYLLSGQYKAKGDLNKDNPLGTGGRLLEEFADLLRQMWAAKNGEKSPSRFRSQLGKACPQFAGADQQDAQEYLNYMLDVLHEDSNRVRDKPYVEGIEDDWVKSNSLRRVGDEAWRRFLRRNRSIMADVAMGQVLSTVTCPVCQFSSRNFDPFNLLSVPFPTVAGVVFQCFVLRRATAMNTPWVLNKPRKGSKWKTRFVRRDMVKDPKAPSEQYIMEQYVIAMSRLADSGDLKLQLQNLCGIPANQLRLCRAEEIEEQENNGGSIVNRHTKVTPLTDKEGPCSQFVRRGAGEDVGTSPGTPAQIVAFELTVRPRPIEAPKDQEDDSSSSNSNNNNADGEDGEGPGKDEGAIKKASPSKREVTELERHIDAYGNAEECRVYDTETIPISKAISRSIWPRTEDELKLGLRVDAIDHRDHWFPGSVVEIIEGEAEGETTKDGTLVKTKVRIHFDNFSSKWDEVYTIDHFMEGRVRPLYSHATPRAKPTEFIMHHRFTDRATRSSTLFGQSYYVQCHNEWSTARAGAQILAQASRFLRLSTDKKGSADSNFSPEKQAKVARLYDRTQAVISDLIDLLIDVDREYVQYALGIAPDPNANPSMKVERFRNPGFDATAISSSLVNRVNTLLHRLPFEVRVCTVDAVLSGTNEEVAFPFSLMRTIGNYMNVRHAIVLQWREPPSDKKAQNGKSSSYINAPVMYVPPTVAVDQISAEILNDANQKKAQSSNTMGSGGLKLGVCLTEFCKVQQLSISDNWRCPRCRDFREGKQNLELWRLPDLLTFHIKRFNCSARWREKITTKVNFPLTGLDMAEWCHKESPGRQKDSGDKYVYDLIGVLNHYGSMTGGHYVATCKATTCGRDGSEEVSHGFNGSGVSKPFIPEDDSDVQTGWRIGRSKTEVNHNKVTAVAASKAAAESAEPLWLQFDDDLVEPIPPQHVVSEMAYVLFYRRRRIAPANIAKYSTLD